MTGACIVLYKSISQSRCHRGLEKTVRTCDGTGCEFESWCLGRMLIPCAYILRLLWFLRGLLGTYGSSLKISSGVTVEREYKEALLTAQTFQYLKSMKSGGWTAWGGDGGGDWGWARKLSPLYLNHAVPFLL